MRRLTILLAALGAMLLVPAAQALANGTMTVNIEGSGSGEVSSAGGLAGAGQYEGIPPIECTYASPGPATGVCIDEMSNEEGPEGVALHAEAAAGSELVKWKVEEGVDFSEFIELPEEYWCASGNPENCWVGRFEGEGGNAKVTAVFCLEGQSLEECLPPPGPALKLTIEEGSGTVVSNPAGLECSGAAPKSCTTESIETGKSVTLTASPAAGFAFKSWKKCEVVNGRKCTITLSAAKEVGVKFVPTKNVKVNVVGSGSVKSKPGGINCLPACSTMTAAFTEGSPVELLQTPAKHFTFSGWSGDCSGTGPCSLTMSADKEVTATFTEVAKKTLTLTKTGGGTALIKTKPTGINCGYTCSTNAAAFYEGEAVEVAFKLNKGTTSLEWTSGSGSCTGKVEVAEGSCSVTMSAAKSLTAKLE